MLYISEVIMNTNEKVDVKENNILSLDPELMEILLKDKTTNKNILWATDNYKGYGSLYFSNKNISLNLVTGKNGNIIKPRTEKTNRPKEML